MEWKNDFIDQVGIDYPIIGGAMYPCSNVELVAAVSEAGGIGIVQPMSLVYVHGMDFRKGLERLRGLTKKPFGLNIILESTSEIYLKRAREWIDISLEMGCRFFVTSLGNPKWVVTEVKPMGGIVYHDITAKKWANKAIEAQVDGLICVNNEAGGHAGTYSPLELYEQLKDYGLPLICAGGIGDEKKMAEALAIGYSGVQIGTRFIATIECNQKQDYKQAILNATANDIVVTERVTGIPLSVIKTPYVEKVGTKVGPIQKWLFTHSWTKKWIRMWYWLKAFHQFKNVTVKGGSSKDYWQAGKSVEGIHEILSVKDIIDRFITYVKETK
ncbi:Nitronate monooxygenase [Candidatus Rubidus massiliensis]|nr:Nitronate monooxygenase [Candidatus Rubidus massiliensis]